MHVDVNVLSDSEAEALSQFDASTDEGLDRIAKDWVKPRFEEWDERNRSEMLAILSQAKDWDRTRLGPVFDQFAFPGAGMNFDRFIDALRRQFLT